MVTFSCAFPVVLITSCPQLPPKLKEEEEEKVRVVGYSGNGAQPTEWICSLFQSSDCRYNDGTFILLHVRIIYQIESRVNAKLYGTVEWLKGAFSLPPA